MATERGLDRIVFFSDAVVAIAITLLILPLVDAVPDAAAEGLSVGPFIHTYFAQIVGFAISFVVIVRLWRSHHAIFRHVRAYSQALFALNMFWLFSIALLPLPTAIITQFDNTRGSVALYIGTMAASSIILLAMMLVVRGSVDIETPDDRLQRRSVVGGLSMSTMFIVALGIGVTFPSVNLYALFALFLSPPLTAILMRTRLAASRGEV